MRFYSARRGNAQQFFLTPFLRPDTFSSPNRLQHASRHLTDAGILGNWSRATGERFVELGSRILENPVATFEHTLRGGQPVKGFLGLVDGQNVVIFVFKGGKYAGEVATAIVPSAGQVANWSL